MSIASLFIPTSSDYIHGRAVIPCHLWWIPCTLRVIRYEIGTVREAMVNNE